MSAEAHTLSAGALTLSGGTRFDAGALALSAALDAEHSLWTREGSRFGARKHSLWTRGLLALDAEALALDAEHFGREYRFGRGGYRFGRGGCIALDAKAIALDAEAIALDAGAHAFIMVVDQDPIPI